MRRTLLLFSFLAPTAAAQAPMFPLSEFAPLDAQSSDRAGESLSIGADHIAVGIRSRAVGGVAGTGVVATWPRTGTTVGAGTLVTSPTAGGSAFGISVVLDSGELMVGETRSTMFGNPSRSAVHRYADVGGTWTWVDTIENPGFAANNQFASSLDRDGDLVAVGAPAETTISPFAGAVFLYRQVGGAWQSEATLVPSDGVPNVRFGETVAVSGDVVVVGSPNRWNGSVLEGAAYVFERVGGQWIETARLAVTPGNGDQGFGVSVDVDGSSVAIGAARTNDLGAAYVFARSGGSWVLEERLQPAELTNFSTFGHAVSIEGDELVVGAWQESVISFATGSAWVFERSAGAWRPVVRLVGNLPTGFHGYSVDSDGAGVVVVGAPSGSVPGDPLGSGAISIYRPEPPLGTQYCSPVANSSGVPGRIAAVGSDVVTANDVTLMAYELPSNAFGFFLGSRAQGLANQPGGSQGVLCLGGAIGRYVGPGEIANSGAAGFFSLALDLARTPQPTGFVAVAAGETWNFQTWHRDIVGGVSTSNFTDAVSVVFQ